MTFLIQQTLLYAVPLLIVALAGVFAERSGIINLALEGIMIFGAFVGVLFVRIMQGTALFGDAYAAKNWLVLQGLELLAMLAEELRSAYAPVLTHVDPEVRRLVKAADKLSAYIKCVEELKAGNTEFREAAGQTRRVLEGYGMPEVDYFLATFMESFSLTLDELK